MILFILILSTMQFTKITNIWHRSWDEMWNRMGLCRWIWDLCAEIDAFSPVPKRSYQFMQTVWHLISHPLVKLIWKYFIVNGKEHDEQSPWGCSLFNLKEYFLWACSRLTVYSYLSLLQIFLRHVDTFKCLLKVFFYTSP